MKVLDDGFVRLVDNMGDDSSIVQAARISYGAGTKSVSDDRGLIRYLMRHHHTTPFEMVEFKFHVRVPMDCWRQWIRHRTASVNEYSTRYSEAIDSMHKASVWRRQSTINKQGSGEELVAVNLSKNEHSLHEHAAAVYRDRLDAGVAREQARKDLPLSTYTEAYWKMDLHNLFHFLRLRLDSHAQLEIRQYAEAIATIVKDKVPIAWEAFVDYWLEAVTLSRMEWELIYQEMGGASDFVFREEDGLSKREQKEFKERLLEKKSCPDCVGDGSFRDESKPMGQQWQDCPTCNGPTREKS